MAPKKKRTKRTPKLKVTKISVLETYELVDWPEECPQVPTYFQLMSTLELVSMYKKNPKHFKPEIASKIKGIIESGSLPRFEREAALAEEVQTRLYELELGCIEDNMNFPLNPHRRQDN